MKIRAQDTGWFIIGFLIVAVAAVSLTKSLTRPPAPPPMPAPSIAAAAPVPAPALALPRFLIYPNFQPETPVVHVVGPSGFRDSSDPRSSFDLPPPTFDCLIDTRYQYQADINVDDLR